MRDPHEILGIQRGASFEEIRAAYRRACKMRHPDMGGSHEQMVELNTAYAFILDELKRGARAGAERAREEAHRHGAQSGARSDAPPHDDEFAEAGGRWRANAADIDEELDNLRRASESLDERLRAMRQEAWREGEKIVWAKLTWEDLARFFVHLARSGVKGLATLFAALIGIGAILVETNLVSALVILGSGLGLLASVALKSDKGGFMSAGLLLFGLATVWLPPVRAALFTWPLATISVLICLGLILKFTREGGVAGLMTGGVLALFMIGVIVDDTQRQHSPSVSDARPRQPAPVPAPSRPRSSPNGEPQWPPGGPTIIGSEPLPQPPTVSEPRTLIASQGAILKFVNGVQYRIKIRSGHTTSLVASQGQIGLIMNAQNPVACVSSFELNAPAASSPYTEIKGIIGACASDAVVIVVDIR